MPWLLALDAKTTRVESITDTRGAPAETQNSFGFLIVCMARISVSVTRRSKIFISSCRRAIYLIIHSINCNMKNIAYVYYQLDSPNI